jgi:hypothetical protein
MCGDRRRTRRLRAVPGSMVQSRVRSPVMPRTRAVGASRASNVPWSMMATRSLSVAASSMSWW